MKTITCLAIRVGLLPPAPKPLIDPAVEAALHDASTAAKVLSAQIRGPGAVDAMLFDAFGARYIPPMGKL
jgi:hypothetical protein